MPNQPLFRPVLSRREMLQSMSAGFGFMACAGLSTQASAEYSSPLAPKSPHFTPRAKRVIFVAMRGGDRTAYLGGQVTLNPLPHIQREPFGMVILPLLMLFMSKGTMCMGYASTPIDPIWAYHHPRKAAVMSSAGPLSNHEGETPPSSISRSPPTRTSRRLRRSSLRPRSIACRRSVA